MADGQFLALGYCYTDGASRRFIWFQGARGDLCAIYGYRCNIWSYGGYYGQIHIQVR